MTLQEYEDIICPKKSHIKELEVGDVYYYITGERCSLTTYGRHKYRVEAKSAAELTRIRLCCPSIGLIHRQNLNDTNHYQISLIYD